MSRETGIELVALARLLALAFAPPDGEGLAEIGGIALGLRERASGADRDLAELSALLETSGRAAELASEYTALFDGEAPCPPYEGSHEVDPFRHTRQMADLAGFYRAFGAASVERPGHAGCELEFLSFLVASRLAAEQAGEGERAAVCREAEDAFLRDHLGRWFPTFCRRVVQSAVSPFYVCVARLGERAILSELARRDLEPEPLRELRRSAVEAEFLECGAATGSPGGDG